MRVTEDMDPAAAEKYVFKRFRWRLPEVLQELYVVGASEGKIRTVKEARKSLSEQERVDALQVAAKRWRAIKLKHDGREIRLRNWRDFQDNTSCSAGTWRTGRSVMSSPLCSISSRTLGEAGHVGGSEEGQEQPHRQDGARQGAPQEGGELDKSQSGPGLQDVVPAERPPHHRLRGSRKDIDLAPGRE